MAIKFNNYAGEWEEEVDKLFEEVTSSLQEFKVSYMCDIIQSRVKDEMSSWEKTSTLIRGKFS